MDNKRQYSQFRTAAVLSKFGAILTINAVIVLHQKNIKTKKNKRNAKMSTSLTYQKKKTKYENASDKQFSFQITHAELSFTKMAKLKLS